MNVLTISESVPAISAFAPALAASAAVPCPHGSPSPAGTPGQARVSATAV